MRVQQLVEDARKAAKVATENYIRDNGEPEYPCGFAWVEVKVDRTNSPGAKALKAAGFTKDCCKPKTLVLYNPSNHSTQNMDIKYAGAQAFAAVLRQAGFIIFACSRMD